MASESAPNMLDPETLARLHPNALQMAHEFLQSECATLDALIDDEVQHTILTMRWLLVVARSLPEKFGELSVSYSQEQAEQMKSDLEADMDALSDFSARGMVYRDCPQGIAHQEPSSEASAWNLTTVKFDSKVDPPEAASYQSLPLLQARRRQVTRNGKPPNGYDLSVKKYFQIARAMDITKTTLASTFASPEDVSDLLDAYAVLIDQEDRSEDDEPEDDELGPNGEILQNHTTCTHFLIRMLIILATAAHADQADRMNSFVLTDDMAVFEHRPGSVMTWAQLGRGVVQSKFVKDALSKKPISNLVNRDEGQILETEAVGAVCNALATIGTCYTISGPVLSNDDWVQLTMHSHQGAFAKASTGREFYDRLIPLLTTDMNLMALERQ